MKNMYLTMALLVCALVGVAQELQFPSGKEKHDAKPVKFHGIPHNQRFIADNAGLQRIMGYQTAQKVTIPVAAGYVFKGVVIGRQQQTPDLFTVTIRSTEDENLMLSLSRVMINGQPVFRGIIISKQNSDLMMLEPDDAGNHFWNLVKVSSLLAD